MLRDLIGKKYPVMCLDEYINENIMITVSEYKNKARHFVLERTNIKTNRINIWHFEEEFSINDAVNFIVQWDKHNQNKTPKDTPNVRGGENLLSKTIYKLISQRCLILNFHNDQKIVEAKLYLNP